MARFKGTHNKPVNMSNSSKKNENEVIAYKSKPSISSPKNSKRPISKSKQQMIKKAKKALSTGELAAEDKLIKMQRDLRTLYIRYIDKHKLPNNEDEVKALHKNIRIVRLTRRAKKRISHAFVEFDSEEICEEAKASLDQIDDLYVDFVGIKSKSEGKSMNKSGEIGQKSVKILPSRLMVSGLAGGINEEKLRQLFPQCISATIPKGSIRKESSYGFVQFQNPVDAKKAFEAAKNLVKSTGEKNAVPLISVVYARVSNHSKKSTSAATANQKSSNDDGNEINSQIADGKETTEKNENDSMQCNEHPQNEMFDVKDETRLSN